MLAATVSRIYPTREAVRRNYVGWFGIQWDGKKHADKPVAYRERGKWVVNGEFLTNCSRPEGSKLLTGGLVVFVRKKPQLKIDGESLPLPEGCTSEFTQGGVVYTVVEVPCFIEVVMCGKVFQIVGCLGSSAAGVSIFYSISPRDEWLQAFDAEVIDVNSVVTNSPPSKRDVAPNPDFLSHFAPDTPPYTPSSPKDSPTQRQREQMKDFETRNAVLASHMTGLPLEMTQSALEGQEVLKTTYGDVVDVSTNGRAQMLLEVQVIGDGTMLKKTGPHGAMYVVRDGKVVPNLEVVPRPKTKKLKKMDEAYQLEIAKAFAAAVEKGELFDSETWFYDYV